MQVPFHGRRVRGWVLGSTDDVPRADARSRRRLSRPIRCFDAELLGSRALGERAVRRAARRRARARSRRPRVAAEEGWIGDARRAVDRRVADPGGCSGPLPRRPRALAAAGRAGSGPAVLRPAPEDEVAATVEMVRACLAAGRRAIVMVPEAATRPGDVAAAIVEAFGDRVRALARRVEARRYRTWLEIAAGPYDVVVGTRPAVFAPVPDLGADRGVAGDRIPPTARTAPRTTTSGTSPWRAGASPGCAVVLCAICPSSEAARSACPR